MALTRSTRHLSAFLHHDCAAAYQHAFSDVNLGRAADLKQLLLKEPDVWTAPDTVRLLQILNFENATSSSKSGGGTGISEADLKTLVESTKPLEGKKKLVAGNGMESDPTELERLPLRRPQDFWLV